VVANSASVDAAPIPCVNVEDAWHFRGRELVAYTENRFSVGVFEEEEAICRTRPGKTSQVWWSTSVNPSTQEAGVG
jgi:hypothetical protein